MLKLTLVIPVYNEEHHIKACLDAVAKQQEMPDEVIVVDNNCTDRTIQIAKTFDFVTVIKEPLQGRGHARSAGFNTAKSEIIGRIDADSRIASNWVKTVKEKFSNDSELMGLTGLANTAFLPYINVPKLKIFSRSYFWFAHAGFNTVTMWGANMAIRKTAWGLVKNKVCLDDKKVHEDQDISLCMAAKGMKIAVDNHLLITTNGQTYRYLPKLLHYSRLYESTKKMHIENGNLLSPNVRRLGFFNTLPGRIYALPLAFYLALISLVPFPIDFVINKIKK